MKSKIYFPNLNGLRFIAASMVLFPHIEQIKALFGLPAYNIYPHPDLGKLGVMLFFVLSGFLITYLLMQEKKETGTISIWQFYVRRMLRIYPLYYLIIFLALFILPQFEFFRVPEWSSELGNNFLIKVLLHLFFFPNVAGILFPPVPLAHQVWSIGVEEQFYFLWAILTKKSKNILNMLIAVIVFYLAVFCILIFLKYEVLTRSGIINTLFLFWRLFCIDCMAVGGTAAYLLFHKKTAALNFFFNKYVQFFSYSILIILIGVGFEMPFFTYEVFAVLFAIIILNLAGNDNSILKIENKLFNYLGKISYGLYMYHLIAIVTAIKLALLYSLNGAFIYAASFLLTVLLAALSYELFEKKFIRAKIKYSKVISGDNVKMS